MQQPLSRRRRRWSREYIAIKLKCWNAEFRLKPSVAIWLIVTARKQTHRPKKNFKEKMKRTLPKRETETENYPHTVSRRCPFSSHGLHDPWKLIDAEEEEKSYIKNNNNNNNNTRERMMMRKQQSPPVHRQDKNRQRRRPQKKEKR